MKKQTYFKRIISLTIAFFMLLSLFTNNYTVIKSYSIDETTSTTEPIPYVDAPNENNASEKNEQNSYTDIIYFFNNLIANIKIDNYVLAEFGSSNTINSPKPIIWITILGYPIQKFISFFENIKNFF